MIVLVTGASVGFGAAIARRFVAAGHKVIATARRKEKLDALQQELGQSLLPYSLDVCDVDAVAAFPAALPAEFAAVDILINNAGLALGLEPAHKASLTDWDAMIATNITGLTHMTRAFLPGMVERNRGHIVNISSVAGRYPYPGGNVYGGTKAFVTQFGLNLRADLAGTAVRVTTIAPGLCGGTEFSNVRFHGDDARAARVYDGTEPLTADDIAEAVLWTVSQPAHVNINSIEMMPTCQSFSPLHVERDISLR